MSLYDEIIEFADQAVVHKRLTAGDPDGMGGFKNQKLETVGTIQMFVDFISHKEARVADKYAGRELKLFIGPPNAGINSHEYLEWNGKKYEIIEPDDNASNQNDQCEHIGLFIEYIDANPEIPDVTV